MKALYIDQATRNPESFQNKRDQTIKGADVFEWNLLSALLEYGTYDAYFVQGLTEEGKQTLLESGLSEDRLRRLVPAPIGRPLPLKDSDQAVFMTAGRYLNALGTLRQKLKWYGAPACGLDRKSTRLNSSHVSISYAVFCLKKKYKLRHEASSSWYPRARTIRQPLRLTPPRSPVRDRFTELLTHSRFRIAPCSPSHLSSLPS